MSELTLTMQRQPAFGAENRAREMYDPLHWLLAGEVERMEREVMDAKTNELRVRKEFEDLKKQAWAQKWIAGTYPKSYYGDCEECGVHPGQWHLGGCSKA